MAALMVGVGEEDLKQKENAQLNFTAEHDHMGPSIWKSGNACQKIRKLPCNLKRYLYG